MGKSLLFHYTLARNSRAARRRHRKDKSAEPPITEESNPEKPEPLAYKEEDTSKTESNSLKVEETESKVNEGITESAGIAVNIEETETESGEKEVSENTMNQAKMGDEALEGTFAMIKPDAVDRAGLIFTRVVQEGFLVVEQQRFRFSRELAELFYQEHRNKGFFEDLIDYITSGPVIALCLARKDGLQHWRQVLGPTKVSEARKVAPDSIRAIFGDPNNDNRNACHGSDSPQSAEREIEIIFPHILRGSDQQDQLAVNNRPGTAESAMVNGHTFAIRDPKNVITGEADIMEVNEANLDNVNKPEVAASADKNATRELNRHVDEASMDNKEYLQRYVCPTLLKGLSELYETRPQSPISWLADWLEENNPRRG